MGPRANYFTQIQVIKNVIKNASHIVNGRRNHPCFKLKASCQEYSKAKKLNTMKNRVRGKRKEDDEEKEKSVHNNFVLPGCECQVDPGSVQGLRLAFAS